MLILVNHASKPTYISCSKMWMTVWFAVIYGGQELFDWVAMLGLSGWCDTELLCQQYIVGDRTHDLLTLVRMQSSSELLDGRTEHICILMYDDVWCNKLKNVEYLYNSGNWTFLVLSACLMHWWSDWLGTFINTFFIRFGPKWHIFLCLNLIFYGSKEISQTKRQCAYSTHR